jgi:hypothetical protein
MPAMKHLSHSFFTALRMTTGFIQKFEIEHPNFEINLTFAPVNPEVSYFNLPIRFPEACHQAYQQNHHSIFFNNDLLHQITGSIIIG